MRLEGHGAGLESGAVSRELGALVAGGCQLRGVEVQLLCVAAELGVVALEGLDVHVEREVDHEQEFELQEIHLSGADSAHLTVVCVVVEKVVIELGGQEKAGDGQTVDVEGRNGKSRVVLDQAVDVNQGQDIAFLGAWGILDHAFKVVFHRDGRGLHGMESGGLDLVERDHITTSNELTKDVIQNGEVAFRGFSILRNFTNHFID